MVGRFSVSLPTMRRYYAETLWYAIELKSDIECGSCLETFNTKNQLTDRIMLRFTLDDKGKVAKAEVVKHMHAINLGGLVFSRGHALV